MVHTAPISKAMSQLAVHAEIFVLQGILVLTGLVYVWRARHPMELASVRQGIYCAMELVSTKLLMITIAVNAEMLAPVDRSALRDLVSLTPM